MDDTKRKRPSPEEQLEKITEQMAQLKAKRQAIANREKEKERKARTRRLIEKGALAEKYLNSEKLSPADFERLLNRLVQIDQVAALIR